MAGPVLLATQAPEEQAVLQEKVARFGRFFSLLTFGTWGAAAIVEIAKGEAEALWGARSVFHGLAGGILFGVWLLCRRGQRSESTLLIIETVGIVAGAGAVTLASLELELELRPEQIMVFALTHLLVLRAVLVPSSGRNTFLIAVLVGVVILPLVGARYLGESEFLAARERGEASLAAIVAWTASLWLVTVITTTLISRVIYGLRRDVRAAQRLGQYTLDERLGGGGMSEVWRATHGMLRRPAAIKLIKPRTLAYGEELARDLVGRFEREARATAQLESPYTVDLYDFGVSEDGVLYHVIELLNGCDLHTLVATFGTLPPERAIYMLRQICHSLDEAHEIGLVHRDIKPANIFVAQKGGLYDFIKVLDFGLVKIQQPGVMGNEPLKELDREGIAYGTLGFMAPELICAETDVDGRADIYAVGCVAHWLLTGRPVFEAQRLEELASAHLKSPPHPPSRCSPNPIPPELDGLVLECLAKDREQRPPSALELGRRLALIPLSERWSEYKAAAWWKVHAAEVPSKSGKAVHVPSRLLRPRRR